ncbi:MAG: hypothetical protein IT423_07840 [Pirellulaceae bacterium]|nr:hypothetical protein [Pirellulaceae bacterium]
MIRPPVEKAFFRHIMRRGGFQPDLVIVDVSLPHMVGQNVIAILRDRFRQLNVIVISPFEDRIVADRISASGSVVVVLASSAVLSKLAQQSLSALSGWSSEAVAVPC